MALKHCQHSIFFHCRSSKTKLAAFQRIGEKLGLACYVNGAFAVMLYLARHFYDDFEGGILTNVNIGGSIK